MKWVRTRCFAFARAASSPASNGVRCPRSSGGSGSGSASGSGGGAADFALTVNYQPPAFTGYLVRGGLLSCALCTTSVEPRYRVTGFTPGWDSNTVGVVSLNGFSGAVTLAPPRLSTISL